MIQNVSAAVITKAGVGSVIIRITNKTKETTYSAIAKQTGRQDSVS